MPCLWRGGSRLYVPPRPFLPVGNGDFIMILAKVILPQNLQAFITAINYYRAHDMKYIVSAVLVLLGASALIVLSCLAYRIFRRSLSKA